MRLTPSLGTLAWTLTLGIVCWFHAPASAATWQVPGDFGTIQEAIAAATNGDTVLVADGTYTGAGNKNLDFQGKSLMVTSAGDPTLCIIDCENDGRGFLFNNGEDDSAVVSGFTIRNGRATTGGGVACLNGSSPRFLNCRITANTAEEFGGGVYCSDASSPGFILCDITDNKALFDGGGLYCLLASSPILFSCTLSGNEADWGGGIGCKTESSPKILMCDIENNTSSQEGGGLFCDDLSGPLLLRTTFSQNNARWGGGGLFAVGVSSPRIIGCSFSGNQVYGEGGAISAWDSILLVLNCTVFDNDAVNGGGIACHGDAHPFIMNTNIFANRAKEDGGALFLYRCLRSRIAHCTLQGNEAAWNGGGKFLFESSAINTINSIFWGDAPEEVFGLASDYDITFSDIQGGHVGIGNINADPLLRDPASGDLHLTAGSPCIDRGTLGDIPLFDFDWEPRPFDRLPDMGSDEYSPR